MKPAPFTYVRPASLPEALDILAEYGEAAKPIAGGQSLMPMLNLRLARTEYLVDIMRIPELNTIEPQSDGGMLLGALVRHRDLVTSPCVRRHAPLLAGCAPLIGHTAIRNRGTLGGSIVHADPAAELPAALVALNATVCLASARGERELPATEFFLGIFTTATSPDELVVSVRLPPPVPGTGWAYLEMARRHGDFALVGVAAGITLDAGGRCSAASIVLSGVSDVPYRAADAEALLVGTHPEPASLAEAAYRATASLEIAGDSVASGSYRREVARVYTKRALGAAYGRAYMMEET